MNDRLHLRVRFPVDDAELSGLHARAFGPQTGAPQPWRSRLDRYAVSWVGAFSDETLCGFVHACWDGGTHAFLLDTAVDPHYQRRGIGRAVVHALIDEVSSAGCEWLHVDYEPHLIPFYQQACGFRSTDAGLLRLSL